jgi:hypothetical protein
MIYHKDKVKKCIFWHYYPIIGGIVEKEERQKTPRGIN